MKGSDVISVPARVRRITLAFALVLTGATGAAQAACVDSSDSLRLAPFELIKTALLKADFAAASAQIDLGGNRENDIRAGLSRISRQNIKPFTQCVLLARRQHSPQYVTEIVYYTDGDAQEYWLMVSGTLVGGDVQLIDVQFSNDFKRFREWLE